MAARFALDSAWHHAGIRRQGSWGASSGVFSICGACTAWKSVAVDGPRITQRRWWWDPDASRKTYDKPLMNNPKSRVFVSGQVPVVLLENVRGIGKKGQIVSVRRGYARHNLVPKGLGVFGTWENIDLHADPDLVEDPALKGQLGEVRGRLPFDWVGELELRFVRKARDDQDDMLLEPLTVWDILEELSNDHELDLLPANLELPAGGILKTGLHEVPVRITFRNPQSATGRYTLNLEVVSQQSLDELRRQDMARAVQERRRFELPQRAGDVKGDSGFDDGDDMDEYDQPVLASSSGV